MEWFKKFIAYHAPETADPQQIIRVKHVYKVWEQHDNELNDVWHLTNPQARLNIGTAFRKELELNWSKEFSELSSVINGLDKNCREAIKAAYASGYMMGKGWISEEHMADFNIYLGDKLAHDIKTTLPRAKSRGIAFASAFASVAVQGQLAA